MDTRGRGVETIKAILCIFHGGYRYQQELVKLQKRYGVRPDFCWANRVKCDDRKDMERRCPLFFLNLTHLCDKLGKRYQVPFVLERRENVNPRTTADRLRTVWNGNWSKWEELSKGNVPKETGQGVYILRANRPIQRIRGQSDVLYIGRTNDGRDGLQNRLMNHVRGSNEKTRFESSSTRYLATDLLSKIGMQVQFSYRVEWDSDRRKKAEQRLLCVYRKRHIELPPGNSTMPGGGYEKLQLLDSDYCVGEP